MAEQFRVNMVVGKDEVTPAFQRAAQAADSVADSSVRTGRAVGSMRRNMGDAATQAAELISNFGAITGQSTALEGAVSRVGAGFLKLNPLIVAGAAGVALFGDEIFDLLQSGIESALDGMTSAFDALSEELSLDATPALAGWNVEIERSNSLIAGAFENIHTYTIGLNEAETALRQLAEAGIPIFENLLEAQARAFAGDEDFAPGEVFDPIRFEEFERPESGRRSDPKREDDRRIARIAILARAQEEALEIERDGNQRLEEERKRFNEFILEGQQNAADAQLDALHQQALARIQLAEDTARAEQEAEEAAAESRKNSISEARSLVRATGALFGGIAEIQIIKELALAGTDFAAAATAFASLNPVQGALFLASAGQHISASVEWGKVAAKGGGGGGGGGGAIARGGGGGGGAGPQRLPQPDPAPSAERGISGLQIFINNSLVGGTPAQIGNGIIDAVNQSGERNTGRTLHSTLLRPT